MKLASFFLYAIIGLLQVLPLAAETADNHGVYYHELEMLKKAPETKLLFDEDAHQGLARIQRDTTTYKKLTSFQRLVRRTFLALDVVVVTPETLPLLYAYVDGICRNAIIETPAIFITRKDGFFNAAAQKLLMSSGAIVIGQKLMRELSDNAIEAVVAHEIGHIKHNHVNKTLALIVLNGIVFNVLSKKIIQLNVGPCDTPDQVVRKQLIYYVKLYALLAATWYVPELIINKRFEKEADEFAYKTNGKGAGIVEFFELILTKDQLREEEFVSVYALLQKNKANLSTDDYYCLMARYYLARAGHAYTNLYKKMYYETFIGAHPSPQARIYAAKEYMAQQHN